MERCQKGRAERPGETCMKHRKSKSFSKSLLRFFGGGSFVLTVITVIMAVTGSEYTGTLESLAGIWFGGLTAVSAFYLWKSKNENRYKYGQMWINSIAEKYGIENAARFFETTVKGD